MASPDTASRQPRENHRTRVLSFLKQRAERGEPGLRNKEIRAITYLDLQPGRRNRAQLMKKVKVVLAEVNHHLAAVTPLAVTADGGVEGVYAAPHWRAGWTGGTP